MLPCTCTADTAADGGGATDTAASVVDGGVVGTATSDAGGGHVPQRKKAVSNTCIVNKQTTNSM